MTTHRIEVAVKPSFEDPRGAAVARRAGYLRLPIASVRTSQVLKLSGELDTRSAEAIRLALTDPVTEHSVVGRLDAPHCNWVVRVGFKPGVTDTVARTAIFFIQDVLFEDAAAAEAASSLQVFTERLYFVAGETLAKQDVERLARDLLANPLIETIEVVERQSYQTRPVDLSLPLAGSKKKPRAEPVPLPADDAALEALSRERTLALSLNEMRAIRQHMQAEGTHRASIGLTADPTDIELECLAQTWSEHCKHKIFSAHIEYSDEETGHRESIQSLFKTYIVAPTHEIAKRVDWLVSVFHDNAGVVRLDEDWNLVFKVETHNSPSALDPYGGSITGIVGVNRDPFGTGMGAALLTNTWGYCLGSPFYQAALPEGLHHPRRIRDGVHQGVIDGGNQSGIPYSRGFEIFDDRFIGKPLVFCGTVGLMPARVGDRPAERKEIEKGDIIVMVGGRIGKDGIHGATFSSEALSKDSPAQAVQIGDPLTQKMMTDMLLEARDQGLYRALTDNGAGGLSSSVGEMAELCGGAELDLEKAPLKYEGLMPWEVLLSEAQERMTLAVPPDKLPALLSLAQSREVEATAIGRFTDSGRFTLRHGGELVGDLSLEFLHGGCPVMQLEATWPKPQSVDFNALSQRLANEDIGELLAALPGRLDLCSKERKARQYDHEVKGLSVIKPLVGRRGNVPADATVMRVRHGSDHGVLLSEGISPRLSDLDAGAMTRWVMDLAVRRIIAGGGDLARIAALDNFCWPDPVLSANTPDGPKKLAGLVRSCKALAEMTTALGVPLISGKDSMKNDSVRGGVKISIPPTLLLSTMGWVDDVRQCVDLVGNADDLLYMVGETADEIGGSELWTLLQERDGDWQAGSVPSIDAGDCQAACTLVQHSRESALLSAAHALHRGGLAGGICTLALAADTGVAIDLDGLPIRGALHAANALFSESGSRFLVAVSRENAGRFEELATKAKAPAARIGSLTETRQVVVRSAGRAIATVAVDQLLERFEERLRDI